MTNRKFFALLLSLTLALSLLFTVNAAAAVYALGDVNGDGKITSSDARIALRCAAKLERLSEARTKAADVDRSGKVNSTDARMLLRAAAKIETIEAGEDEVFEEPDVLRRLTCVGDDVVPVNFFPLGGSRVAVYCSVPFEEGGEGPDENGAYGAPRSPRDETLLPGEGDFTALEEDGRDPAEIGEGDFSALDEDGRDPAEIGEGDFPALDEDGRDPAEIDGEEPANAGDQFVYIVDIEKDELLDRVALPANQFLFCIRENGQYVVAQQLDEGQMVHILDYDMQPISSFQVADMELIGDRENDCFYLRDYNSANLYRGDFDGNIEKVFSMQQGMTLIDYDTASGIAAVGDDSAVPGKSMDVMLYDVENDSFIYEKSADAFSYMFTDGLFLAQRNIEYPAGSGEYVSALNVTPVSGGEDRLLLLPKDAYAENFDGTDALFISCSYYDPDTDYVYPSGAYLADPVNGRITLSIEELNKAQYFVTGYAPEADRILAAYYDGSEGEDRGFALFTIDPSAAQYVDELEQIEDVPAEYQFRELTPGWEDLREKADAIERDFDITLYFGDQALDYQDGSGYVFVSLENEEYAEPEETPKEKTDRLLDTLRSGLSQYPEGFFTHFKNARGQGGVRIMLVQDLLNPDGEFLAGGVAYKNGAWYDVALTAGNMNDRDTIHHELWHATESLLQRRDMFAFSDAEWDALNPEDFLYSYDLDAYYENEDVFRYIVPWDYDASTYDGVYFAEIYSTVTPNEDRATLLETLTSELYAPEETGFDDPRDWIARMPHLQAKLDYMAEKCEAEFGYVYWETILERMPKG